MPPFEPDAKPPLKERFSVLLKEYGTLALLVYFALFVLSLAFFAVAIEAGLGEPLARRFGVSLEGAGGRAGTLFAAWALTKVIQVPRILATLALTPLVGRIPPIRRLLERIGEQQRPR
ncbi:MAG: DUF1279 domain-containing protein [Myxococcales bacterium]